jgi:hypothetical protein
MRWERLQAAIRPVGQKNFLLPAANLALYLRSANPICTFKHRTIQEAISKKGNHESRFAEFVAFLGLLIVVF